MKQKHRCDRCRSYKHLRRGHGGAMVWVCLVCTEAAYEACREYIMLLP